MDKFNLVVRAARELARAVQENYYDLSDLNDIINYSEVAVRSIGMTGESCTGEWPREYTASVAQLHWQEQ